MELMNGIQMPDIDYGTWKLEKGSGTTEAVARAIACVILYNKS